MSDEETTEVEMVPVEFDGVTYDVPKDMDDWPYAAAKALESGRGLSFVEAVLGATQHRKFLRGGKRTARDGAKLMSAIMSQAYGVEPGE